MNTIFCPRCGTENPPSAMNCMQCRINLQFAQQNPDEVTRIINEQGRHSLTPIREFNIGGHVIWLLIVTLISTAIASALGAVGGYIGVLYYYEFGASNTALIYAYMLAPIGSVTGFIAGLGTLLLGKSKLYGLEWALITALGLYLGFGFKFNYFAYDPLLIGIVGIPAIAAWIASGLTMLLRGDKLSSNSSAGRVLMGYLAALVALFAIAFSCLYIWVIFFSM